MTILKGVLCALLAAAATAWPQTDDDIIGQRVNITLMPLFQDWSIRDAIGFSEMSLGLSAFVPLGRSLGMSMRGSYAAGSGDITHMSDLSDAQLSMKYHLESAHLVFSCGVNLPTGRRELSADEFATSLLFSNQVFDLAVPNYGQGWGISPAVSWALKLSENVVLGLGGTYQYKGSFTPLAGLREYDPGNEALLTAGFDFRLNESTTISADAIFTTYNSDRFDGEVVFASGNKLVANVRLRTYFGTDELAVLVRYHTRAKNDVAVAGMLVSEPEKTVPDQMKIVAEFVTHIGNRFVLRCLASGAFFENTSADFSGMNVYGLGVAPEIALCSTVTLPFQFKILGGTQKDGKFLTGLEAGVGLSVAF